MLAQVQSVFAEQPIAGIAAVYLFGSHARGQAHADSDVDIAVLLDAAVYPTPAARFDARLDVIAHIGGRLGAPTDIVILNDAPPLLGRAIITDGIVVTVPDPAANHVYRRDVQLQAADLEPFIASHRRGLRALLTS